MLLTVHEYSKIMTIIILAFVNSAYFGKTCKNYACTFYFKFGENTSITMQQTSKSQAN